VGDFCSLYKNHARVCAAKMLKQWSRLAFTPSAVETEKRIRRKTYPAWPGDVISRTTAECLRIHEQRVQRKNALESALRWNQVLSKAVK
tara:strand:+ start:1818 stop:2084 length:267 start_codon:yes stop_codon:yes gene_type:complete